MSKIYFYSLFLFIMILPETVFSQSYGTALGLRVGSSEFNRTVGLTLQQRIVDRMTLEAILQSDFKLNSTLSVLAQRHNPIISKRFNFYYGAGIAFGNEESFVKNRETQTIVHSYGNSTLGVDFIAGIELSVASVVVSLDYKPNINLSGREEFYRGQVGISARTVLVKTREQKKRQKARQKARKATQTQPKKPFSELFKKD